MDRERTMNFVGWTAVILLTGASSFWAYWGVNEAFHEGWCKPLLWMRLLQVLAYLSAAIVLCTFTVLSLRWPRVGATLFFLVGVMIAVLTEIDQANIGGIIYWTLTVVPALVGGLFLIGRPKPKRAAYTLAVGLPLMIVIGFGAEPVVRVSNRFDDGERGSSLVEGNGVTLLWAPAGPGWSREGNVTWAKAVERARYLNEEGAALAEEPQEIWRLPTREEVVRSLTRGDRNAGGTWDPETERASYDRRPDKESPLWDPFAPLIYLWTAEEADEDRAWIVVYHGGVYDKPKRIGAASFGFRAVREPPSE